ncbi:hypothetical protein [Aquirhabdus sp.]|uniref:hypothetical protein n=1 Tax=Aquirhabdus sp. TaxID=2824160 RepID=UPI00396C4B92
MHKLIVLILVAMLAGCERGIDRLFYNHSVRTIVISVANQNLTLKPSETKRIPWSGQPSDWEFKVCLNQSSYHYQMPLFEFDDRTRYRTQVGITRPYEVRLQIESNGKVNILPQGHDFPQPQNLNQPNGYPLQPQTSGHC